MVALIAVTALTLVCVAPADAKGAQDGSRSPQMMPLAVQQWRSFIVEASCRFSIPQMWIVAVMTMESGGHVFKHGQPTISRAGAAGLMQLMPRTWAAMRFRYGLGKNVYDPHDNIMAGAAYLRSMYDRFGYPGLFAAYNAGPARYDAYLTGARPLPFETRAYLAALTTGINLDRGGDIIASGSEILVDRAPQSQTGLHSVAHSDTLFFDLSGSSQLLSKVAGR